MSDRNTVSGRKTTNVIAASGRLKNEHFLLTADHILLEVDADSFELVSAKAEGNIQVHLATPSPDGEHVIFAETAIFQPHDQRLKVWGWIGTRENGIECPPATAQREMLVPTDGTYFLPLMQDHAEKRLPIAHKRLARAA